MRFKKLDLNLLVALDILLEQKSITRTAEKLNMSPSAVSNSLSRLREYFEDDLLTQIGRKMVITPLGENLQSQVRNALYNIESTILLQPNFEPDKTERIFSIICSDYTLTVLVPHILEIVSQQKSTARFQFLPQVENPNEQLEKGKADLLIIPTDFVSKEHPSKVIYDEKFVCVVWSESELADGKMTMERYANAGHVVMRPAPKRPNYFEKVFSNKFDLKRRIVATTFSFAILPSLVIGSDNITTVHSKLAYKMAKVWPLKILELPFELPRMQQCLQWHQYRNNDEGLIWLRGVIEEAIEKMNASHNHLTSAS
ncbi:LysR family transcriptional regulator [Marinomonas sp. THO17]|uniref:LysR family transcriptional regulator n=1 Tax=Marinomonas sp. THO17 TaxID=3149048 RepID=UPI00336C1B7E